jgi:hypothetical protein
MTGLAYVSVTEELKITDIKIFYKPENFLKALESEKNLLESEFYEKKVVELHNERLMSKSLIPKMEVNGEEVETIDFDKTFLKSFHNNFPFEVVEVFSEEREIVFSWRHWIEVKENEQKIELKGFAILKIDDKNEIEHVKAFYKTRDIPIQCFDKIKGCIFARTSN